MQHIDFGHRSNEHFTYQLVSKHKNIFSDLVVTYCYVNTVFIFDITISTTRNTKQFTLDANPIL